MRVSPTVRFAAPARMRSSASPAAEMIYICIDGFYASGSLSASVPLFTNDSELVRVAQHEEVCPASLDKDDGRTGGINEGTEEL